MSARNPPLPPPTPAGDGAGASGQGSDPGREPASRPLSMLGLAGRPGAAGGGADAEGGTLLADGADETGAAARAGSAAPGNSVGRRARVNAHNLITLGVMLVSSGMVYGMRQYAMGAGIKYARVDINYPLDGPVKPTGDDQRIMADLRRSEVPVQIPADQLQKNPFMLNAGAKLAAPAGPKGPDRQEQLRTALGKLALRSVMDGKTPVARINDELVRVGDKVGGVFTVTGIHGRTVELLAEGAVFTLGMPDRPGAPGGAGPGGPGAGPGAQGQPMMPGRASPRY